MGQGRWDDPSPAYGIHLVSTGTSDNTILIMIRFGFDLTLRDWSMES